MLGVAGRQRRWTVTGDVGLDTSLALDGSGNPHISYFDVDNLNLKYAYKSGSTWTYSNG